MSEYKIFWKPKPEALIKEMFTTETQKKRTVFINRKGETVLNHKYPTPPEEDEVDSEIAKHSLLDPSDVYAAARSGEFNATGGLGLQDLQMSQEAAIRFEERFGYGLELIEWHYYRLNIRKR